MNKKELTAAVARATGLPRDRARAALDVILEELADALSAGGRVVIPGFGTFSVHRRPARKARKPSTGEPITVPAKRVPAFRAGRTLKERLGS